MNKAKGIALIIGTVIIGMVIAIVVIPDVLVPLANTANATMSASSNMTNYPGTSDFMVASPWIVYGMIPTIGIILIIIVLRAPDTGR